MRSPFDSNNVAYFNAAAFFEWNPLNSRRTLGRIKFFEPTDRMEEIVFIRDNATFALGWDNQLLFPSRKGYPFFSSRVDEWEGKPADYNPLIPEFYQDAPVYHIYDLRTSRRTGELGKLDSIYWHHKAGYRFAMLPLFDSDARSFAYSCGTSGLVHVGSCQSPNTTATTIKVFDVDTTRLPDPPGTLDYLNKLEKKVFTSNINSIKLNGNRVAVLSTEGGTTWLRLYSLDGELIRGGIVALAPGDRQRRRRDPLLSSFYIYDNHGDMGAYTIFKKKGKNYLAMFPL